MDSKPRTPLPPGMVPSSSSENLADTQLEEQERKGQKPKDIVQEGSFSDASQRATNTEVRTPMMKSPAQGTPPEAWKSASEEQPPDTYQIDLSGDSRDDTEGGTEKVSVIQGISTPELGKTPRRKFWSPFSRSKDKVQDIRKELTPKQLLSPVKRNKVAPSPAQSSSLGTSSRPTVGPIPFQLQDENAARPASDGPGTTQRGSATEEEQKAQEPPLTPTVIVKSKDGDVLINNETKAPNSSRAVEELYSSVVKPKRKARRADGNAESPTTVQSDLITELPKLETYDPQPALDTSLVLENQSAQAPSPDYASTDDHAYEMVDAPGSDAPDMPVYSASVYKELKRHEDTGNVKLVSMKGTAQDLPTSQVANFPVYSSTDMSPLHYAAASGDKKELARLLSALPITQDPVEMVLGSERMCGREGLEVTDSEGRTPIMHAVHNNQLHSVKKLAEAGANVNNAARDGSTCLHQAAYSGSIDMVALLLSLGADGLRQDNEGRTPLHWCTNNTHPDTIDLILDKVPGLNADVQDGAKMTPLMWAAFHGHQQHVMKLIERGANPQQTDIDGMTAAHWSVQRHDTRTLQVLISPESAGYRDNKGKTVMHQAAERGSAKAVTLIKAVKPTSVNDQDINGRTPLHWATACENPDAIRALLAIGANPDIKDLSGFTAMDYANQKGLHYCALLLSQSEASEDTDGYQVVPTYGTAAAGFGARALQQQEGQVKSMEDVESILSKDQITQIQTVCRGSWLNKFSNEGRGPTHSRFFWVNPSNTKICWAKDKDAESKDVKADTLVGVRSSSSPVVFSRKDFDPISKHKYSFTIFTGSRVLDVVAASSDDYKLWLNGLQLLLNLGSVNATRLLSIIQNASGGEPKPIP